MGCMLCLSTGNDINSYMILLAYSVVSITIDPYICNASVAKEIFSLMLKDQHKVLTWEICPAAEIELFIRLLLLLILFWDHWCWAGSKARFFSLPIGIKSGCCQHDREVAVQHQACQAGFYNTSSLIFSMAHKVTSSYYDTLAHNDPHGPWLMQADHDSCKLWSAKAEGNAGQRQHHLTTLALLL